MRVLPACGLRARFNNTAFALARTARVLPLPVDLHWLPHYLPYRIRLPAVASSFPFGSCYLATYTFAARLQVAVCRCTAAVLLRLTFGCTHLLHVGCAARLRLPLYRSRSCITVGSRYGYVTVRYYLTHLCHAAPLLITDSHTFTLDLATHATGFCAHYDIHGSYARLPWWRHTTCGLFLPLDLVRCCHHPHLRFTHAITRCGLRFTRTRAHTPPPLRLHCHTATFTRSHLLRYGCCTFAFTTVAVYAHTFCLVGLHGCSSATGLFTYRVSRYHTAGCAVLVAVLRFYTCHLVAVGSCVAAALFVTLHHIRFIALLHAVYRYLRFTVTFCHAHLRRYPRFVVLGSALPCWLRLFTPFTRLRSRWLVDLPFTLIWLFDCSVRLQFTPLFIAVPVLRLFWFCTPYACRILVTVLDSGPRGCWIGHGWLVYVGPVTLRLRTFDYPYRTLLPFIFVYGSSHCGLRFTHVLVPHLPAFDLFRYTVVVTHTFYIFSRTPRFVWLRVPHVCWLRLPHCTVLTLRIYDVWFICSAVAFTPHGYHSYVRSYHAHTYAFFGLVAAPRPPLLPCRSAVGHVGSSGLDCPTPRLLFAGFTFYVYRLRFRWVVTTTLRFPVAVTHFTPAVATPLPVRLCHFATRGCWVDVYPIPLPPHHAFTWTFTNLRFPCGYLHILPLRSTHTRG